MVLDQLSSSLKAKEGGRNEGGDSTTVSHTSGAATWPDVGGSEAWRRGTARLVFLSCFSLFGVRCRMTHSKGNLYANIILPPRPVPLTTHHYLSSATRQQKIIGVSNPCLCFLLFSGEITPNIFFIDLFISVENELLKGLCWSHLDAIRVTDAPFVGGSCGWRKDSGVLGGVNEIDQPASPCRKPRWWPKALSGFETALAQRAPWAAPCLSVLHDGNGKGHTCGVPQVWVLIAPAVPQG